MKKIYLILFFTVFFGTVGLFSGCSDDTATSEPEGETIAPIPGSFGLLSITNRTEKSLVLGWDRAIDNEDGWVFLEYKVVYSTTSNVDTVQLAEKNGTTVMDWTADTNDLLISGLNTGYEYYFNVLVRDRAGNKAAYLMRSQIMDLSVPIPGDGGSISFPEVTSDTITVSWTQASDNADGQSHLLYKVVYSTSSNIYDVSTAEANGTVAVNWTNGIGTSPISTSGLNPSQRYYFTVLVQDSAGNVTNYRINDQYVPPCWVYVGQPVISESSATFPSIAIMEGVPYIAYTIGGTGYQLQVRRFINGAWEKWGYSDSYIRTGAMYASMIFRGSTPYIAFRDQLNGGKASCYTYDGGSWDYYGASAFSDGTSGNVHLSADGSGVYVSYCDYANGSGVTVMKTSGSEWTNVGSKGFTHSIYHSTLPLKHSLAVDNGTPYVVYADITNGYYTGVHKYEAGAWTNITETLVQTNVIWFYTQPQIVATNGHVYVAFSDYNRGNKATVLHYDGTNWAYLGSPGFSSPGVINPVLSVYNGTPYLACGLSTFIIEAYKFNGSNWDPININLPELVRWNFPIYYYGMSMDIHNNSPYIVFNDKLNANIISVIKYVP